VRGLVGVVLGAVLILGGLLATPALAQDESVRGTLSDQEGEPVADVTITVADETGTEVDSATSDSDGDWEVPLPGPGDYEVTLDTETLPEDIGLTDEERSSLDVSVRSGQQRTLIFSLGEREGAATLLLTRVPQSLANGLKFGFIIAMTAIGLSLIFGTTGLINFAHGEMVTFGAVAAFFIHTLGPGMPLLAAAPLAVGVGALLGGGLERGLWRPLRARKTGIIQMLVISIGLAFVIRHIILLFFGGRSRPYLDYTVQRAIEVGPVRLTPRDLTVMALSLVVLTGIGLLLSKTRLGKAMRAVADNRDLAESSGIDVQKIILLVWVIGGALTAMGGVFLGVVENVNYFMGFRLLLLMFAGVILGGLGTAYGAMIGSLVVGVVTELSTLWFSTELKEMWALLVLIIILLFRPQGILGVKERVG
jgi:neutral amino acid transport system permease protein